MRRDEWIHESLEVGSPPLRKRVTDFPLIIHTLTRELAADGSKALVQAGFETFKLAFVVVKVVARTVCGSANQLSSINGGGRNRGSKQFEECVCNLQHQDMRMAMLMAYQNSLTGSAHSILLVMLLQPLETGKNGRVLLRLVLFGAKGVIRQRVQTNSFWLVAGERSGEDGTMEGGRY